MGYQLLHVYTWGLLYLYLYSQVLPEPLIRDVEHTSPTLPVYIQLKNNVFLGLEGALRRYGKGKFTE